MRIAIPSPFWPPRGVGLSRRAKRPQRFHRGVNVLEPLDFRLAPPRGPRETALGLAFLPRTIDKMRAALPGGNLNGYLVDYPRGLSAFLLKRVGVDLAAMQAEVAAAPDEAAVLTWFEQHADLSKAGEVSAKLASLSLAQLSEDDRAMVHRIHPGIEGRPEIETFFDVFEFDDARVIAQTS
jgi:hypothetical protein